MTVSGFMGRYLSAGVSPICSVAPVTQNAADYMFIQLRCPTLRQRQEIFQTFLCLVDEKGNVSARLTAAAVQRSSQMLHGRIKPFSQT